MKALVRAVPEIVRLIGRLVADPVMPRGVKIALAAAVLYLASPLDLLPDVVPLLGYLDDVLIVSVVLDGLLNWVDRRVLLRYWPGNPVALDRLARIAGTLAAWVPNRVKSRIFGGRETRPW